MVAWEGQGAQRHGLQPGMQPLLAPLPPYTPIHLVVHPLQLQAHIDVVVVAHAEPVGHRAKQVHARPRVARLQQLRHRVEGAQLGGALLWGGGGAGQGRGGVMCAAMQPP